jgi:hypothetical protein
MRICFFLFLAFASLVEAGDRTPSAGQSVYLPIYAYVRYGDKDAIKAEEVSTLISVRSTEPERSLTLLSLRYYNTDGKMLRELISSPRVLKPFQTAEFFIERKDVEGGSGASAVLRWKADEPVNPPLVQSLHIEVKYNRALSFTTEGVVIERAPK